MEYPDRWMSEYCNHRWEADEWVMNCGQRTVNGKTMINENGDDSGDRKWTCKNSDVRPISYLYNKRISEKLMLR